ncbi:MAG: hypothetical protein ABJM06_05630 [Gilvibacter sp.]
MRLYLKIGLFFGLFICFGNLFAQEQDPLEKYMQCVYDFCVDGGAEIKNAIAEYDQLLVNENILTDASGAGYIAFFEAMVENNAVVFSPSVTFSSVVQGVQNNPSDEYRACQEQVLTEYPEALYKLQLIGEATNPFALDTAVTPASFGHVVLQELSAEDFELDFYRIGMLMMVESFRTSKDAGITQIPPPPPPPPPSPDEVEEVVALTVLLTKNDELYLGEKKATLNDVRDLTYSFLYEYEAKTAIVLKYDSKANYDRYTELKGVVTDMIFKVRQEYTIKQYGVSFEQLREEEQALVKNKFPNRIIDVQID